MGVWEPGWHRLSGIGARGDLGRRAAVGVVAHRGGRGRGTQAGSSRNRDLGRQFDRLAPAGGIDEKAQIQALDRTQPPGHSRAADPRLHSPGHHQPVRRAGGCGPKVIAEACYPRHTNVEFLAFLKPVAKTRVRPSRARSQCRTETWIMAITHVNKRKAFGRMRI